MMDLLRKMFFGDRWNSVYGKLSSSSLPLNQAKSSSPSQLPSSIPSIKPPSSPLLPLLPFPVPPSSSASSPLSFLLATFKSLASSSSPLSFLLPTYKSLASSSSPLFSLPSFLKPTPTKAHSISPTSPSSSSAEIGSPPKSLQSSNQSSEAFQSLSSQSSASRSMVTQPLSVMVDYAEIIETNPDCVKIIGGISKESWDKENDFECCFNAFKLANDCEEGHFKTIIKGENDDDDGEASVDENGTMVCSKIKTNNLTINIFIKNAGSFIQGTGNIVNLGRGNSTRQEGADVMFSMDNIFKTVLKNNPRMFPNALRRTGSISGKRYDKIMAQTVYFQDNGETEKLEYYTNKLIQAFKLQGEIDLQVVAMIQRGVLHIYQKNLTAADAEFRKAIELAESAENSQLLNGRCLLYFAHIAVYDGRYEAALELIDKANIVLSLHHSFEDSALMLYLRGYALMKMAAESSDPCEDLELEAIDCFEAEMAHAMEYLNPAFIAKKQRFATLKIVSVLLRTYSDAVFDCGAAQENMEKAKSLLDRFELTLWNDASTAAQIQFSVLRADYFYRFGQPQRALDIIEVDGRPKARCIGHEPLIQMVESRSRIFQKRLTSLPEKKVSVDVTDDMIDDLLRGDD